MSPRPVEDDLPHNMDEMQEMRRELKRNAQRIRENFYRQFEHLRSNQRDQLQQEHLERERITTLMHDTTLEAQQQVESISRSISAHGINPVAPSPVMHREQPSDHPTTEEVLQELRNALKLKGEEKAEPELPKSPIPLESTGQSVEAADSTGAKMSSKSNLGSLPEPITTPSMSTLNLAKKPK